MNFINPCVSTPNYFPILHVFWNVFQVYLTSCLLLPFSIAAFEVRLTSLLFLLSSFLKTGMTFGFIQSWGTSPDDCSVMPLKDNSVCPAYDIDWLSQHLHASHQDPMAWCMSDLFKCFFHVLLPPAACVSVQVLQRGTCPYWLPRKESESFPCNAAVL